MEYRMMYPNEWSRLKTFPIEWCTKSFRTVEEMAEAGFYFSSTTKQIMCSNCGLPVVELDSDCNVAKNYLKSKCKREPLLQKLIQKMEENGFSFTDVARCEDLIWDAKERKSWGVEQTQQSTEDSEDYDDL